jgi:hypothetical protein
LLKTRQIAGKVAKFTGGAKDLAQSFVLITIDLARDLEKGGMNMRSMLTGLWILSAGIAVGDPATGASRLAIVSDAGDGNLAALVTTELSAMSGVVLLDRDDLAKIGDEMKVQQLASTDPVALGKLAGADGLIFLDQRPDGTHVRLTAVNLGFALFDEVARTHLSLAISKGGD